MSENNGKPIVPGTFFVGLPDTAGGTVYVEPSRVLAIASGGLGQTMIFVGGGAIAVRGSVDEVASIIAKATGKGLARPGAPRLTP